jgi:RNA polymerase sigma-B factor
MPPEEDVRTPEARLVREWTFLTEEVVPQVDKIDPSRPKAAWSAGRVDDAFAVLAAFDSVPPQRSVSVFATGDPAPGHAVFSIDDVSHLPAAVRDRWFASQRRRWVPSPQAKQKVFVTEPAHDVDLLVVRTSDGVGRSRRYRVGQALSKVRRGGIVLWADGPPARGCLPGFRPLTGSARMLQKVDGVSPARSVPDSSPEPMSLARREEINRLVESHYGLAVSLARKFSHVAETAEDLEQVALLALLGAASRYEPGHNASFSTFATVSVVGELKRHFRDKTWSMRVPRQLKDAHLAVKAAREELGHELGASPTIAQIAQRLEMSTEQVLAAMEAGDNYWAESLDAPRAGEESASVDIPVDEPGFESSLDRYQLQRSLPMLSPIEQVVLRRLFFDGRSQREVAKEVGVSQMQVSRVRARSLTRLRESFEAN